MKKSKLVLLFTAYCLLFTVLIGCDRKVHKEKTAKIPISAVIVKRGDLKETLFFVGDIKAQDEVNVYPRTTGKLLEKLVKDGDSVKKRDVLAYVDRDEIGLEFEKSPVTSPIDGIIGRVYLNIGESVSPQTPVAKVVDMDIVKIKIDIVEKDLPKIKVGQLAKVKVVAYPEEVFEGKVSMVSPVIDLATRTAPVEIRISNPEHILKPGMFARVRIVVLEHNQVPVILRDAIIKESGNTYCFVIRDNKAGKRKILLGIAEANFVEVVSGLEAGEVIVITGHQGLKDGALVDIIKEGQ